MELSALAPLQTSRATDFIAFKNSSSSTGCEFANFWSSGKHNNN
jgi:hypothetical protein